MSETGLFIQLLSRNFSIDFPIVPSGMAIPKLSKSFSDDREVSCLGSRLLVHGFGIGEERHIFSGVIRALWVGSLPLIRRKDKKVSSSAVPPGRIPSSCRTVRSLLRNPPGFLRCPHRASKSTRFVKRDHESPSCRYQ